MVQWEFFLTRPFGQIMALQTIFSLLSMLVAYFAEFWIEATLIINSLHLFNLNKRVVTLSAGINLFFPCTLLLFAISLVYTLIMGFGSLIALIGFVDSFRFTRKYMITYALLSRHH
ncbi:unnamed protein product [Auanema sp. JU1783]|nr:unnamed protein product [Auanema sp. JU1783]